jgi:hypothetical protein
VHVAIADALPLTFSTRLHLSSSSSWSLLLKSSEQSTYIGCYIIQPVLNNVAANSVASSKSPGLWHRYVEQFSSL